MTNAKRPEKRRIATVRLVIAYAVIAFALSFCLLLFIDQVYLGEPEENARPMPPKANIHLPQGAEQIQVSHDGRYLTYLQDGAVTVLNLKTGKTQQVLREEEPIEVYGLMHDRNRLLYFFVERDVTYEREVEVQPAPGASSSSQEEAQSRPQVVDEDGDGVDDNTGLLINHTLSQGGASQPDGQSASSPPRQQAAPVTQTVTYTADRLHINTYDLDSDTVREDKTFRVKSGTRVGTFAYSTLSNNIGVYLEATDEAGNPSYEVHNVDIMSAVVLMVKDARVQELVALNNTDKLYYTNADTQYLYTGSTPIEAVRGQRVRLLGCDLEDTLYVHPLEEPDQVYLLRDDKLAETLRLPSGNYERIVSNNNSIFFVYEDYVVDILADPGEKIPYPAESEFLTVSNQILYTLGEDGKLSGKKLTA